MICEECIGGGGLAVAEVLAAVMVSALAIRGTEPGEMVRVSAAAVKPLAFPEAA